MSESKAVQAVVLAAGAGTRLGRPYPKPLVELANGQSILGQQISNLRGQWPDIRITIVVGFKFEMIMEEFPDVSFAYNEVYDQTNTSKSLLKALRLSGPGGVLWLNGDVVFDARILERIDGRMAADESFVCVDQAKVGAEEVKYTLGEDGGIAELSKIVAAPVGEAVGINFIGRADKATLIKHLAAVSEQDYFERAMEAAIADASVRFQPVDISDLFALEVDFQSDLDQANKHQG